MFALAVLSNGKKPCSNRAKMVNEALKSQPNGEFYSVGILVLFGESWYSGGMIFSRSGDKRGRTSSMTDAVRQTRAAVMQDRTIACLSVVSRLSPATAF